MKTKRLLLTFSILLLSIAPAFSEDAPMKAKDLDISKSLAEKLQVTPEQAAGGAGSIFNFAKGKLSADDFAKVSGAVPGMDALLNSVPKADESAAGMLSQATGGAAGLASLAGPFQKLGMGPEMVTKFVPEVLNYVQGKGGDATKALLANVLK